MLPHCLAAGVKGRRIRELTSVVQKRFKFPEGSVELYAEKVGGHPRVLLHCWFLSNWLFGFPCEAQCLATGRPQLEWEAHAVPHRTAPHRCLCFQCAGAPSPLPRSPLYPPALPSPLPLQVANRGLCAVAQAESMRYKLLGGLAVRRACYGVLRFVMESGEWVAVVVGCCV